MYVFQFNIKLENGIITCIQAVFVKTAGLSDKTAKFQKCLANFVSLPARMSDEKLIQKNTQTVFFGDLVFNG